MDPPTWRQSKAVLHYLGLKDSLSEKSNQEIKSKWINDLESKDPTTIIEEQQFNFPSRFRSVKKIEKVKKILNY